MLSFLEFDFKWFVDYLTTLSQVHATTLKFPTVSHLKLVICIYYDSDNCNH